MLRELMLGTIAKGCTPLIYRGPNAHGLLSICLWSCLCRGEPGVGPEHSGSNGLCFCWALPQLAHSHVPAYHTWMSSKQWLSASTSLLFAEESKLKCGPYLPCSSGQEQLEWISLGFVLPQQAQGRDLTPLCNAQLHIPWLCYRVMTNCLWHSAVEKPRCLPGNILECGAGQGLCGRSCGIWD